MHNRMRETLVLALAALACAALAAGCTAIGKGSTIVIGNGSPIETGTAVDEFAYDDLSAIDVELDIAEITVKPGSGFAVSIDRKDYPALMVDAADGKLAIMEPEGTWDATGSSCSVAITVPASAQLGQVDLETDTGAISVEGISAASLEASSDVGELSVSGCAIDSYNLATDVGSIAVSGIGDLESASLDLESDVGAIAVGGAVRSGRYSQSGSGVKIAAKTDTGSIEID